MARAIVPSQDLLVTTAIRFLTTVSLSVHHNLFSSAEVLQNVCERIVSPNVQLLQASGPIAQPSAPGLIQVASAPIDSAPHPTRRMRRRSTRTRSITSGETSRAPTQTRAGASRASSCAGCAATTRRK